MLKARVIVGCPGAGKSTWLAERANTLRHREPLLLSFTRAAAGVIERKLKWGGNSVKTIHAHCYREIGLTKSEVFARSNQHDFCSKMGIRPPVTNFEIYVPSTHFLEVYSYAKTTDMSMVAAFMKFKDTVDFSLDKFMYYVSSLQNYKQEHGIMEFDDMLEMYSPTYAPEIIMVDEAQDLSIKLIRVLEKMVRAGTKEIWMIGDPNQSIYTYAGADPDLMYHFGKDDEDYLEQSYRCPPEVVAQAKLVFPDARFLPADKEGKVVHTSIMPAGAGMVLSRTNFIAHTMAKRYGCKEVSHTMHKAKGLESDHVVFVNSQTRRVLQSAESNPEAEKRVVYTALTRAKRLLTIVEEKNPYGII